MDMLEVLTRDPSRQKAHSHQQKVKHKKVTPVKENYGSDNGKKKGNVLLVIVLITLFAISLAALIVAIIAATRNETTVDSTVSSMVSSSFVKSPLEGENYTVVIPASATKLTQNLYYIGQAMTNKRQIVNGYIYVNRVSSSLDVQTNDLRDREEYDFEFNSSFSMSECFGTYARGARWKQATDYVVDPGNRLGLSSDFVYANVDQAVKTWNDVSETFQIFGRRINKNEVHTNGADLTQPDGYKEIRFGNIGEPGVVALTCVWGIFDGKESERKIVEFDQVYDQVDWQWNDANINSRAMDFLSILTHELGHAIGLTDQYEDHCSEATMYGYSRVGEIKKRTLAAPDKNGICYLYGSCRH